MTVAIPSEVITLCQVTRATRERLNDPTIGVSVRKGQYRVVRVTYQPNGKSVVLPLSPLLSLSAAIAALESL